MPQHNEREFLQAVLQGNGPAIAFTETLFRISQVLDDLVDRDKPVSDAQIYRAFWEALIDLPGNPFYRQHEIALRPLMASALQDWWDATRLESESDIHGRTLAFVLRDMLTGVVVQCAGLVGGFEWMQAQSVAIRKHFHEDTFGKYLDDLERKP
jgi:hypothetical protein